MIVVLAGTNDPEPEQAFRGCADVAVIRPEDLSRVGWCWRMPGAARLRVPLPDGQVLHQGDVGGVLTRVRRIYAHDLPHVDVADRDYVAAEMTAFLAAVLASLTVTIVNRGDAASLCGPHWTVGHWLRLASSCGLPVCACGARHATYAATVVGDLVVSTDGDVVDGDPAVHARRLARAAQVDLLGVCFCTCADGSFVSCHIRPPLTSQVVGPLLDVLRSG